MASNTKDVKLTLSVETLGEADIKALQQAVLGLAKGGSDAEPEFQRLADQIDRLGEQNQALQSFKTLNAEVEELTTKQGNAATRVQDLTNALQQQGEKVAQARDAQKQATQALIDGQKAYVDAGNAVRLLKTETDSTVKTSDAYAQKLRELVQTQNESRSALIDLRANQKAANTEVTEAVQAQSKLQTAYNSAAKQSESLNTALAKQTAALQQSATAAEELGASTADIATSEASLLQSFNAAGDAARRRKVEIDDMAESDRLLAIEEKAMAALYARSQQELNQLTLAQVDAVASIREYERAQAEATAKAEAWQREAEAIVNAAHAAQELARQTEVAAAVSRELSQQDAFAKAAADAQKLVQAADYVRFWEQALEEGGTEAQKTAAAAVAAAERIENAFKTVGVRSVESLNQEIVDLRTAMEFLRSQAATTGQSLTGAFTAGEARVKQLELQIRELNGTLTTGDRIAALFKNSLGQIAAGNVIADGVGYLVNKVKELAAAFVDTIAKQQQLSRALNAIYKDTQLAGSQMEFLRRVALDAGVAVGGIQQSFTKFSAATKSANIPLQQSNALFEALVKAGGTLGLSAEDVSGSLEALSQMASKGTVSMEELRQQLGDRLPGALSLVAKGLGLTDSQLIKLVESGGLAARDLFPALTSALKGMQGEVSGLTPSWETLKNAMTAAAQNAGDAGWVEILTLAIRTLAGVVGAVVLPLNALVETMGFLTRAAATMAGALATGTNPMEEIGRLAEQASERQAKLTNAFGRATGIVDANTEANSANAAALAKQSAEAQSAASNTQKLQEVSVSTQAGQTALQAALSNTTGSYVKLNAEIAEQIKNAEKQAESANKMVRAAQDEGAALIALAKLRGDDRAELEAAVRAKELELAAQQKVAEAKQVEFDLLKVQQGLLAQQYQQGQLTAAQYLEQAKAIEVKVGKAEAEAAQAKGAISNLQLEIATRQTAVKTYGDQSAALDKLKDSAVATQAAFIAVSRAFAEGRATVEQVRAASIAAAQAQAQYNDALRDSVDKIRSVANLEQAKINVQQAGLGVQQNAYNLLANSARASGDYAAAIYYEVQAKRIQIQITDLQAKAKKLEAQAEIDAIEAERQALIATNNLTDAKKRELEIRSLNAKAKLIEAKASEDIKRAMEAEITALLANANATANRTNAVRDGTSATNNSTSSIDANADALDRQAAASERAAAAERKRLKVDENGFSTDKSGKTISAGSDIGTRLGIVNFLKSAGVDEKRAMEIANSASDSQGNVIYNNNPLQLKHGGVSLSTALMKEAENYLFSQQTSGKTPTGTGITPQTNTTVAPTTTSTPTSSTSHTVTVNVGNKSTTINTASAADANNLATLLKSLETAAGTSA